LSGCARLVLVEDTYGVEFHRVLHEKLGLKPRPRVERLPAKKCNPKIYRSIMGRLLGLPMWRVLVVIDLEDHPSPGDAVRRDFCVHVRRRRERFRVAVAVSRHEAWLCTGLTGRVAECSRDPERVLEAFLGRPYEKQDLARLAPRVDVGSLRARKGFQYYVKLLRWLASCR